MEAKCAKCFQFTPVAMRKKKQFFLSSDLEIQVIIKGIIEMCYCL